MAEFAGAANGGDTEKFDLRSEIAGTRGFFAHQRGAEIFLVVVAEDGYDGGVSTQFLLRQDRGQKIAPRGNPHREPQRKCQLLRHEDGIAIGNGEDFVEFVEADNSRNEFVGDALDAVIADFAAGGEGG